MKKLWNKITAWFRSLRIKYILWRADRLIAKVHKQRQKAQQKSTNSG